VDSICHLHESDINVLQANVRARRPFSTKANPGEISPEFRAKISSPEFHGQIKAM
jgi:hypothetical protein